MRVDVRRLSDVVGDRLQQQHGVRDGRPLFVGIDGRSGAGKTTLAASLARELAGPDAGGIEVTVIEGDDFYAGGSARTWDRRSPQQMADAVIDVRRQRRVLEQLGRGAPVGWRPFDWDADGWDSDEVPLAGSSRVAQAAPVIVLEGAYSCRPELHDLLDLRVLLDVPHEIRRRRLLDRNGDSHRADWDARWSAAEEHYFAVVMPPERFDLILRGDPRRRRGAGRGTPAESRENP